MPSMVTPGTDLVEARVLRERAWALEAWHARLSWGQMRVAMMRPIEDGGLGYESPPGLAALKSMVKRAQEEAGDLTMGRAEKAERQGVEVDARIRLARYDLEKAHAAVMEPMPLRVDYPPPDPDTGLDLWRDALDSWHRRVGLAVRMVESADKRLEVAHAREARLFGMDAPTRVEAEVTTRDGDLADLNAMLVEAGLEPMEVDR